MADTNVHWFNGTFMIFATHDFSVNNTGFLMKDWWVWSSSDLVDWTLESTVSPEVSLKWDTQDDECWATDAAFVNGRLFFYVSAGGGQIAVMVADSIKGPWSDPIGKPLMSPALGAAQHPPTTFRDPCVFNEPGTDDYYIIAGVFEYYVTKLGADMVSLAESPRRRAFQHKSALHLPSGRWSRADSSVERLCAWVLRCGYTRPSEALVSSAGLHRPARLVPVAHGSVVLLLE